jgi:hypothetical protein
MNRDNDPLLHDIGALAIEKKTVYCGTGHAYRAGDSFPGVGLFRSDDNGASWNLVKKADATFPHRISTIAVDGAQVWIGGIVVPEEEESEKEGAHSGIFYSLDRGHRWQPVKFKLNDDFARRVALSPGPPDGIFAHRDYQCHSIVFAKDRAGRVILAAITAPLNWGGIWRSADRGSSWEQLRCGLPSPREFGRTNLAVFRKEPNIVYAYAGATDGPLPRRVPEQ